MGACQRIVAFEVRSFISSVHMEWLLLTLLLFGTGLSVVGWFFDRLSKFGWLLRYVDRNYYHAVQALRLLRDSEKRSLLPAHAGFRVLLNLWPADIPIESIALIGRSVAFIEFGATVRNDFELLLYDSGRNEISPRWSYSEAYGRLSKTHRERVFWMGTGVFFVGIAIVLGSRIIDLLDW